MLTPLKPQLREVYVSLAASLTGRVAAEVAAMVRK